MSLIAETDLAGFLPDMASADRQALLDSAEAHVSRLMGRTLSREFDPDGAPANPGQVPGVARVEPLGLTSERFEMEIPITGWLIPIPLGPVTQFTSVTIAGAVVPLSELQFGPWSISKPRSRTAFSRFQTLVCQVDVGWANSNALPAEIRQSIIAVALSHSGSAWAGGASIATGKIVRESIGPYTAAFADPTSGSGGQSGGGSSINTVDRMSEDLLRSWRRPTEGIGL